MTIVNIQSNEQEKKQDEETYKAGDFFVIDGDLYVLAQVAAYRYNLFCVSNMNRYSDMTVIEHVPANKNDRISLGEVEDISGCSVIPVKSVSISYSL